MISTMNAKLCWALMLLLAGVCHGESGFFWHITDIHYDPWYHINQESCHKNITDAGKYGDYECDAPWDLVFASIKAMVDVDNGRDADFILWSGDNPPHAKNYDVINQDILIEITKNITEAILSQFPDKMVLPVLGNHDYYPKDQLPGEENDIYNAFVSLWTPWLNTTDMRDTFKRGGYYTRLLSMNPKIRAVVLNTNLYYAKNEATEGQIDPGGQFAWLDTVMEQARANGEKVHMFYHVPVGKVPEGSGAAAWLRPEQNALLVEKVVANSDLILGMYTAHAHQDTYKLFYNQEGVAVSSLFIPPSVTPWKLGPNGPSHNPALRRYVYERETYELIDVEQYSLNLPAANNIGEADWLFLYSFRQTYGLTDIRTPQLQLLLEDMKEYGSEKFHRYYDLNMVDTKPEDDPNPPCDCLCKTKHLCSIENVNYDSYDQCYEEMLPCDSVSALTGFGGLVISALVLSRLII